MKISEIYSAMGLKIKLSYEDSSADFQPGNLIRIEPTHERLVFLASQYGKNVQSKKPVLCKAGPKIADYLLDLFEGERENAYRCMFLTHVVENECIVIQTYIFQSVTEYKTPINIIVPNKLQEAHSIEKLRQDYIWDQLGIPALFCLNYKNKKRQNANVRFIGGRRYLVAQNTARGIIAESVAYLKDKYDIPVDIFVAPEIKFIPMSDIAEVNDALSADLEKISNPASYFARWEAYDELNKKLLEKESEEFGEITYTSYDFRVEVNGITYEFNIDQELDDSLIGKEVGASEAETVAEQIEKNARHKKQIGVGKIKKVTDSRVITFLEGEDDTDLIPKKGVLKLYTAGEHYIMKRRLAARERMIKHRSPIKSIVALIESGASSFEMLNSWGSHKAVTEELRRNFKRAAELNPEQVAALDIAVNTPDIALIQGPPGTGKTTVIKAIAERFREIFEAEQRQYQKINPEHILQSPKILISSFQNEAVDNAISAPLPGDIPAYRKTAKRTSEGSKEQYQKSLDKWYTGLKEAIKDMIEDKTASEFISQKRLLDDEFLSYKNAGEPIEKAVALIKRYLSYVSIPYPNETIAIAKEIITAATEPGDEYENPIIRKIEAQRTSLESFKDDGQRNARRLIAYIRINDELGISDVIKEAIEAVCDDAYSSEDFERYVKAIGSLRKIFCRKESIIDTKDTEKVNECILKIANTFSNHYLSTLSSIESKKSLILSDFLARMGQDYEMIVRKYSMTTAATCQTSLDFRDRADKIYDLVIVDEAARANPLDLFIPMSMGKKIVLVGDHKQLPHMLEPDVLKLLTADPRFRDIPEIEKSLFERLFDMFSKGQKPKALPLTQQFRMHPEICNFVSDAFYDGRLKTAKNITSEMRASSSEINHGKALVFVNIPISRGAETPGVSKSRWAEIEVIGKDVRHILDVDQKTSIGIITFYLAQAQMLEKHLDSFLNDDEKANIEVGTVDAFQGKEFDYVLLSCVRSNSPGGGKAPVVGFLEKPNRLCVAFSRSIRQLAVYGDAETLIQIPCFSRLYEICAVEGGGCYREC
ncbi:AAA domain-containing protein [Selenomonas sp. AB3002]|uniref:DEAD/DEAH box helicase n=1 Tax=Selenomonas sp. AB3002 TaxID=1392502 RepID=UPI00049635C8